jgi:hypothetical protein
MAIDPSEQIFYDKSQIYQKWLIRIISQQLTEPVLIVWLTDLSDKEIDKMVLTKSNRIAGAIHHTKLFEYLFEDKGVLPDPVNTLTWMDEVSNLDSISVTNFNINHIENSLSGVGFNKISINESINFINLFRDLALQLNDKVLYRLSRKKEIMQLWEFGYDEIFWKEFGSGEEIPSVRIPPLPINFDRLKIGLNKMINSFINKIEIIDK